MQITQEKGKLQKINVMVCTYNEPMETVRDCVQHLLDSPEPVYASKHVYIGDDGAKKKFDCSEQKRQMVEEFHRRAFL
jgi:cellulose synthase/poly-beta-1,6-N-acetylglucosamine synthase-like glycosyltransferase